MSVTPNPASLPPVARSAVFRGLTAAAAHGRFELQRCVRCGAVQYPPREACHRCLSPELPWTDQPGDGELISQTTLFHSHDAFFRERLPWRVGLVRLDCGPGVVAHVHAAVAPAPARVRIIARLDKSGQAVLIALPAAVTATATAATAPTAAATATAAAATAATLSDDVKLSEILLPSRS